MLLGEGQRGQMEKLKRAITVLKRLVMWHGKCGSDISNPFLSTC